MKKFGLIKHPEKRWLNVDFGKCMTLPYVELKIDLHSISNGYMTGGIRVVICGQATYSGPIVAVTAVQSVLLSSGRPQS